LSLGKDEKVLWIPSPGLLGEDRAGDMG